MSDDSQRPIIIKKVKKTVGGAHGGAWKIAYADFVTAMMAFFLLMWLLGSTTAGDLKGISEYFKTPLKVALSGGSGAGDATSIIKGGGEDLSHSHGQVKHGEVPAKTKVNIGAKDLKQAQEELAKQEKDKLKQVKKALQKAIESNPEMNKFKNQLLIDITSDGLRIQIVDVKNRPMFAMGSAVLQPYARDILHEIAKIVNEVPNKISLSGHTDATPYSSGEKSYSNWELSADRANASRRELINGGMEDAKILRVVGLAAAALYDKNDPYNPINRRISIIVMNKQAEETAIKESEDLKVDDEKPLTKESIEEREAGGKPAKR